VSLEEKFIKLSEEFVELQKAYAELRKENAFLKQRIVELEDKLGLNSSNSGLPTSKEIYKIERKQRLSSGKNPGGQPGHKFNGYKMKEASVKIELLPAEESCVCGGELNLSAKYNIHQKIEILPITPVVTEYYLREKICNRCSKNYKAELEDKKLLGKNVETIIASLGGFFNNSKREIQEILSKIFNLDISLGLVSNSEGRVSSKIETKYEELKEEAIESSHLHMDETGANNKGKRHWCWIAGNKEVTVFKLANSRGKKALISFLPEYEGKVISDRYGVYNTYEKENRQICLAHLRRDFKRFAHSKDKNLAIIGGELVKEIDEVFTIYREYKTGIIKKHEYRKRARELKQEMLDTLNKTYSVECAKQAQRVAGNIIKSFEMMWRFIDDDEISPTNNFAERQIKHYVKYRKNSYFTWSDRGDRFLERIKSIYATAKLRNLNPFLQILQLS
jgi:transposase